MVMGSSGPSIADRPQDSSTKHKSARIPSELSKVSKFSSSLSITQTYTIDLKAIYLSGKTIHNNANMLYKIVVLALLGFNSIVASMAIGNRETIQVARSEEVAAIPPVIIIGTDIVDPADE
ncbi:hypothetical protein GGR54DRAFT_636888 [Hypoxylon sp. NC1633]|nr:hypothetical protein GGR54DRAFT_636888 [Hypoxylon sp. NC1633]